MAFFGRKSELERLNSAYHEKRSILGVIYGRRRVGKSHLVKTFCRGKNSLTFEGLEREPLKIQISNFTAQLKKQIDNSLLQKAHFNSWEDIFDFLTEHLKARHQNEKLIIFFDEFPWMASSQTKLVSLLKYYWDNHWKEHNVFLILCGSISSYMVKNVIRSTALYGRISLEMKLEKLTLPEAMLFFKGKRSLDEILKYLMLFGGVPKYLEEINLSLSFSQNIQRLCFDKDSFFVNEFDKMFYSHFREQATYKMIFDLLSRGPFNLKTIGEKVNIPSGGGLKGYLNNLEASGFIGDYLPYDKPSSTKLKRFSLIDEYTLFYFKFILPNKKAIQSSPSNKVFSKKVLPAWEPWLGFAFENLCLQNANYLARILGFSEELEMFGPYFERGKGGFQIDLLFKRFDKVITLCELKFHNSPVEAQVIAQVEKKAKLLKIPRGYTLEKVLIAPNGADKSVAQSEYFHQIIDLEKLMSRS